MTPVAREDTPHVAERLRAVGRAVEDAFLGKEELVRLMLVSVVAGEHLLVVGPPGTAKSAVVRTFAELIDARYFEYLLTRFTEPNELFGPVDIAAFREGTYRRRTDAMLPEAEIVFLDEIFRSNSAILNSLLTLLNERVFQNGSARVRVPLLSVFGATNEVPNDESLQAIFDRFLLRVKSDNLDSYQFRGLVDKGLAHEARAAAGRERVTPTVTSHDLHALHGSFDERLSFSEELLAAYKGLVFQIRSEGVSLSDRRIVKLLKLFAASAWLDGRPAADASDFFVLRHVWNNLDQADILAGLVDPVVDAHYRTHPQARRRGAVEIGIDALVREVNLIRDVLTRGDALSDIQLFTQLRNLNEVKAALQAVGTPEAKQVQQMVDQLLETVFESSKFAR